MSGFRWLLILMAVGRLAANDATTPGPSAPHHLRLATLYNPQHGPTGLLVKARVSGGPPLRLILDSGAQHLTMTDKAAGKSGLAGNVDIAVVSAGSAIRSARLAKTTVQIGDLLFRECPVAVTEGEFTDGVDGVIPLALFRGFSIRLDVAGGNLDLDPYPADARAQGGYAQTIESRDLLFVLASLGKDRDDYLLLDTGSAYNAISDRAADGLGRSRALGRSLPLTGGAGSLTARLLPGAVSCLLGGRTMALHPLIAMDMDEISRRSGLDVSGVLGYPALARTVLTVNYRERVIRIEPK